MLLPTEDAARFLAVYKQLLATVAGRVLDGRNDYAEARDLFFGSKALREEPPTESAELLTALQTASCGQFIVGRHMVRFTEMIGPENRVYRVRGITNELSAIVAAWSIIRTAVMQFNGI